MNGRYLLDTNICIYIQKQHPVNVLKRFEQMKPGDAFISIITWGELMYGSEKSMHKEKVIKQLEEFIVLIPVLPLPVHAGGIYGNIRAFLQSTGQMIGNNDLWIASHAMADNLTLVTNNEREFNQIPDLKVENWV